MKELVEGCPVWALMGHDTGWRKAVVKKTGKKFIFLIFLDNKNHFKGYGKRLPEECFSRCPALNDWDKPKLKYGQILKLREEKKLS